MSIKVRSVGFRNSKKTVLSGVSFDINDREIVFLNNDDDVDRAILGILSGLEKASNGTVTISGYDIEAMNSREKIKFFRSTVSYLRGYFLQSNLTVKDNIALPGIFLGMPRKEILSRIASIASLFYLSDILKMKPKKLSDGQKEKVCVARTLFTNPKVILAIEPSEWATQIFSEYAKEKNAIFIYASNNNELRKYAIRVLYVGNKDNEEGEK